MATETYELCIDSVLAASYRSTVLHFSGVGVATGDTVAGGESLIAGFRASLETLFLARLPQDQSIMQYRARRVSLSPSAVAKQDFMMGDILGSLGFPAVTQQTCPSIFLIPTMGTKSGGKIFWPGVAQSDIVNNAYAAAFKTAIAAFIVAAQTGFTNAGITWTLAIYSRKHNTTSPVTNFSLSPLIGFQSRRRKPTGAVG